MGSEMCIRDRNNVFISIQHNHYIEASSEIVVQQKTRSCNKNNHWPSGIKRNANETLVQSLSITSQAEVSGTEVVGNKVLHQPVPKRECPCKCEALSVNVMVRGTVCIC